MIEPQGRLAHAQSVELDQAVLKLFENNGDLPVVRRILHGGVGNISMCIAMR
ncbi:hypothetical protein K3179_11405 [Qipengyuania sp. GH38]|uniref:hypothetical protein n=1 Tax=Qipengyuania intermedia TaxID=2867244 RepID=UPI001C86E1EF|nr:hypothetical protein [Qipengyuania intermedia]MBX7515150.1 hypothetical protein [Qipengyuania intermedia]